MANTAAAGRAGISGTRLLSLSDKLECSFVPLLVDECTVDSFLFFFFLRLCAQSG